MLICFFDWYLVTFYYFNVLALVWWTAFEFLLIFFAWLGTIYENLEKKLGFFLQIVDPLVAENCSDRENRM